MRRLFLSFIIVLISTGCATSLTHHQSEFVYNKDLERLLTLTDVPHTKTLDSIVAGTQKKWLRRGERWDHQDTGKDLGKTQRSQVKEIAGRLGYVGEIHPEDNYYDVVLLLGAANVRVKDRMAYMGDLWRKGVRFDRVVMLGSSRPLDAPPADARLKPEVIKAGFQPDEEGMMRYVWQNMIMPSDLKAVPVEWIRAVPRPGKARANTDDTLVAWLEKTSVRPARGMKVLAISNNPHIGYQHAVIERILKKTLGSEMPTLETVGPQSYFQHADQNYSKEAIAVLLDAMARHFYAVQALEDLR